MLRRRPQQVGVSLIEALVALAVMGFGTLGVLGMQASLRMNGDIAKQRSEAVRIAQETLESARAYADMDVFRDGIVTTGATAVDDYAVANASYWVQTQVIAPADEHAPRQKSVVVTVSWTDRADQPQTLTLVSNLHGVPPALAGSLALPRDTGPVRTPGRRHFSIPPEAVMQVGDRTSIFTPPGADGADVRWIFDNVSGMITSICVPADNCTASNAFLLAGHVRFATDAPGQPAASHAESPTGPALPIQVEVAQTAPVAAAVACYEQIVIGALRYFCAVPAGEPARWSGRSSLAGLPLATDLTDSDATAYRVCRYTPVTGCHEVVGPLLPRDPPYPPEADSVIWGMPGKAATCTEPNPQTVPPTPSRIMRNADHPLDYDRVSGPLTNQNFLVIRAGDGTDAFECPGDDAGTPYVNGNTWRHQPHE